MITNNIILLAGRPGVGKTEMLIAYANMFKDDTLFISFESKKEWLRERGLEQVNVITTPKVEIFDDIDTDAYNTFIVDYLELVYGEGYNNEKFINFIKVLMKKEKRIIISTMMRRDTLKINNIFEKTDI